jgi:hypothetical protein
LNEPDEQRPKASHPFEQLSWEEKKAAIDIVIAAVVLVNRLPDAVGKPLYDYLETEFANNFSLPINRARYSLRGLSEVLFYQEWKFIVTKEGGTLKTEFYRNQSDEFFSQPKSDD